MTYDPIQSAIVMYDYRLKDTVVKLDTKHLEQLLAVIKTELQERDNNERSM